VVAALPLPFVRVKLVANNSRVARRQFLFHISQVYRINEVQGNVIYVLTQPSMTKNKILGNSDYGRDTKASSEHEEVIEKRQTFLLVVIYVQVGAILMVV